MRKVAVIHAAPNAISIVTSAAVATAQDALVSIEEGGVSPEVLAALKAKGHDVRTGVRQGDAHSIWVAPDGTPYGVSDKRSPDSKASVPQQLTAPATRRYEIGRTTPPP